MTAVWPAIPTVEYLPVRFSPIDQRARYDALGAVPRANALGAVGLYAVAFDAIFSGTDLDAFCTWWEAIAAKGAEKVSGLEDVIGDDPSVLYAFVEPPQFTMIRSGDLTHRRYRASFSLRQLGLGAAISALAPGTVVLDQGDVGAGATDLTIIGPVPKTITLETATAAVAGTELPQPGRLVLDTATAGATGNNIATGASGSLVLDTAAATGAAPNNILVPLALALEAGIASGQGTDGDITPLFAATPVAFDGTHYLKVTSWASASSKIFVFSAWVKIPVSLSADVWLFEAQVDANNNVFFFIGQSDGKLYAHLRNSPAGSVVVDMNGSLDLRTNTWRHLLLTCDVQDVTKRALVIDGVPDPAPVWNTYANLTINWGAATSTIGARWDGSVKNAFEAAEFYLGGSAAYFDPIPANLAKFISNGRPVNLGATGQLPLGVQALLCMNAATVAAWHTNVGTGGGYTETSGSLTAGTSPVYDGLRLLDTAPAITAISDDVRVRAIGTAIHFGGTNYLKTTAWTSTASKIFVFSAWVRIPTNITGPCWLFEAQVNANNNVFFFVGADGLAYAHLRNAPAGSVAVDASGSTDLRTNTWRHLLWTCDVSDPTKRALLVDLVADNVTWTIYNNVTINWGATTATMGARWDGGVLQAFDMAEAFIHWPATWFNPGSSANPEANPTATNMGRFVADSGYPVALGANGSAPFGNQSLLCMNAATVAAWHTNLGTGGGFTETGGSLTAGTGPVHLATALGSAPPATVSSGGYDLVVRAIGTAVHFSGTNYLKTTAWAPTIGATSAKNFVFSTWVKIPVTLSNQCWLFEIQADANNNVFFFIGTDGLPYVHCRNTPAGTIAIDAVGSVDLRTNTWRHIMWSCNTANVSQRGLVIDGHLDTGVTWSNYNNVTINWLASTATIGARWDGSSRQAFDMAETLLSWPIGWMDPTIPNIVQNLLSDSGYPVALGTQGPFGGRGPLCMNAATVAAWHTNAGEGGGFTETGGALTAGAGPVHL